MKLWPLLALAACTPATVQRWGYDPPAVPYDVRPTQTSPSGIQFDDTGQHISGALIDRLTNEVQKCAAKTIVRSSFVVKVAVCGLSCDGTQQLLPDDAPNAGCDAKGLPNKPGCPCRWRARIAWPNVIVTCPSLYLYKDALTRFVTDIKNPWVDPTVAKCVQPTTDPLSKGTE